MKHFHWSNNLPRNTCNAIDLAFLTEQRPADVFKAQWSDIKDGALASVCPKQDSSGCRGPHQRKTGKNRQANQVSRYHQQNDHLRRTGTSDYLRQVQGWFPEYPPESKSICRRKQTGFRVVPVQE